MTKPPKILFAGDPHGDFGALNRVAKEDRPEALIILGDFGLVEPVSEALAPAIASSGAVYWIHGNHDVDHQTHCVNLLDDPLAANSLNGRVVDIGGVRIAGLGGHFQGKVWNPADGDGKPRFETWEAVTNATPKHTRFRGGPPLKRQGAIYWETVEALWGQSADVLVAHEAPAAHPLGFAIIDELAAAMGVHTIFHGHHHFAYRFTSAGSGPVVIGTGIHGVSTIDGRVRAVGSRDRQGAHRLDASYAKRLDPVEGTFETVETLLQEAERDA